LLLPHAAAMRVRLTDARRVLRVMWVIVSPGG
jgi:hypothetical protein